MVENARKEQITGEVLEINVDDFSYQTDGELLAKIDTFMEKERC